MKATASQYAIQILSDWIACVTIVVIASRKYTTKWHKKLELNTPSSLDDATLISAESIK